MMKSWRSIVLACLLALALLGPVCLAPSPAFAADEPAASGNSDDEAVAYDGQDPGAPKPTVSGSESVTVDKDGKQVKCDSIEEAKDGKLIGKIVPCMARTIENSTIRFTTKMVEWFKPLLYTFLTLVVVLFGVRMLTGEQEIHKHGLVLLIKITLITTIITMIPTTLVPATYNVMKDSQAIVLGAIDTTSMKCADTKQPDGSTARWGGPNTMPVWAISDCILGKLFGYGIGDDGKPGMLLGVSFLGLLSGFLFGGAWGVVVFFGFLGVLISLFMLVARTAHAFLSGYLVICFMLIISPLFLPLMFLRVTQAYADKVVNMILSAFLLPILVTSYTMLGLTVYDRILFADNSMLTTLFDYAKISPAQLPATQACSRVMTSDVRNRERNGVTLNDAVKTPTLMNFSSPNTAASNDLCALTMHSKFDEKLVNDPEFKKGKATYNKIFEQLMAMLLLAYLIHVGLSDLNSIIAQLTLSGSMARGITGLIAGPEERLNRALSASRNSLIREFEKDPDKKSDLPQAMRRGVDAFFGAIGKNE